MERFLNILSITTLCLLNLQVGYSQQTDSTQSTTTFSGSIGISNNGFSIIPSFSLNSPAAVATLSIRKNSFSFEPDIRLVPDASKGGMLWWLRYRLVDNPKFKFRLGAHPAFTFVRRSIVDNGKTTEITEMLRFLAYEAVPSYQISQNFGLSAMYLEGHGLQKHGPQKTRALFLNTAISNIKLSEKLVFHLYPSIFFLYTDGYRGDYLTVTGVLAHKKLPFTLQSTINQTFKSDVPGNQEFMWNVMLAYNFSKTFKTVQD